MKTKWRALATDFDGTIAVEGAVAPSTMAALAELRAAGLVVVMVTGRELIDFARAGFDLSPFDLVIAENGAVLYDPSRQQERQLAEPPSREFVATLQQRGVPLSVGKTIVATVEPFQDIVLQTIHDLHLELAVIFNKGAVMILPSNVNKASGLTAALSELGISPHAAIAVGDGENDHMLLECAGLSVAVSSAIPALKKRAKVVTTGGAGVGVEELVGALLNGTLEHY